MNTYRTRLQRRISYFIAVVILLLAAILRLHNLIEIPLGLQEDEITNIRITETARNGDIAVFYDLGDEGREGLYHFVLVFITSFIGHSPLGFRLLSVWTGLLAVAMTYALGRRLFGQLAGLAAMGLIAVSLWPNLLARQILREALLPLYVAYALLTVASLLPVYRRRRRRGDNTTTAAVLGILLGTVAYIHPSGLLLITVSLLFILYMILSGQRISRRRLSYINFSVLLLIIFSMPYLISSIRELNLSGVARLVGDVPDISPSAPIESLIGLFVRGDPNPTHNLPGRPLIDPVSGLLMLFGVYSLVINRKHPRHMLMLFATVIFSPLFFFSSKPPDFLNQAAALPILAILFGLGLSRFSSLLPRYPKTIGLMGILGLIAFNGIWTSQDLFNRWPDNPEVQSAFNTELGALAQHIDNSAASIPTLLCGWSVTQSPVSQSLSDAQLIRLMLYNKGLPIREADCVNGLVIASGGETQQIIVPSAEMAANRQSEIIQWLMQSATDETNSIEGVYTLEVEQMLADRVGLLTLNPSVSYPPEIGGSRDQLVNTPVNFGGNVTFLGYVPPETTTYRPGGIVTLVTYWRIDGRIPSDLRLFTHILADPGASPPANTDIINVNPSYLYNRDVFVQVTYVPLPESLPIGEYMISIGAYQDTSSERLPVLQEGVINGNRLFLYPITIEA